MKIGPLRGRTRLLLAGFGSITLMLVAGADAVLVLHQVRSSDTQKYATPICRRSRAWGRVRSGIYQSAIS